MQPGSRCEIFGEIFLGGDEAAEYRYSLSIPGEAAVTELGSTIRAEILILGGDEDLSRYNFQLLNRAALAPELTIRNWRAGDRFFPAHTRSPKKVKELLQSGRLGREMSAAQRKLWPVIESAGEIVWMRSYPAPEAFAARAGDYGAYSAKNFASRIR